MIPRIFHRIFLDDPIPEEFERYWERLKELHPISGGWEFFTWNDSSDLGWIRNRKEFDQVTTDAGRSDILRYEILATFGGIYLDTDVEPLRPFDELLDDDLPFAAWENLSAGIHNKICPTVMGAVADHPAVIALLDALPPWMAKHRGAQPNRQTGPWFLTEQWRRRTDVRLLEPWTFYPVHWANKAALGGPYPPESYAVHHWAAGWLPNGPPQRAG